MGLGEADDKGRGTGCAKGGGDGSEGKATGVRSSGDAVELCRTGDVPLEAMGERGRWGVREVRPRRVVEALGEGSRGSTAGGGGGRSIGAASGISSCVTSCRRAKHR